MKVIFKNQTKRLKLTRTSNQHAQEDTNQTYAPKPGAQSSSHPTNQEHVYSNHVNALTLQNEWLEMISFLYISS